jgi:catechol-2,3-dioxygenase
MTDAARLTVGTVAWFDLTVSDAVEVRDFYQAVVGWTTSPVDMGGYQARYAVIRDPAGAVVALYQA